MKRKGNSRRKSVARPKNLKADSQNRSEPRNDGCTAAAESTPVKPVGSNELRIVGIGGSSGSLDALVQLLSNIELKTGMGFVFIQHLDPTHESMLVDILNRSSRLPVSEARDGDRVEPDRLYIIPPAADLSITEGRLRLRPREETRGQHMPIDSFFRALADDFPGRCLGIVLSGSGSDGSHGLIAIKAAGGITFVQEPASAKFDAMPRSAIATGEVDLVLTPDKIAKELKSLRQRGYRLLAEIDETGRPAAELKLILGAVLQTTGSDLSFYKPVNLIRRVNRRMALKHLDKIEEYRKLVQENRAEAHALHHDILISVTSFFRDGASVDSLNAAVFPELVKKRRAEQTIRVWVPGCSTGEEAYSIAIALTEFLEGRAQNIPIQIFATDINDAAIERARAGIYAQSIAGDITPTRLRRFFHKLDDGYQVTKTIREDCVFARHNLLTDPPFS
jgi:two-component system, chemotaxis family, CheB/CheR fusion protein